ncbi:DUF1467 family protein [Stakelama saccharophila]|uniref:DUF1467 family protein n=1 Tax=Stakelama saccharophila TaxID=3075605 RepID=A0ABZ0BC67_9SPHN|nr:DUF1467 family protein [Stakelama sp. W311]WNO55025.1 DUF1467 family protein [Stakelama sp. W311]
MAWQSMLAVYVLFWVITAFVVLPFNVRTDPAAGDEHVPGQADSAPATVPFRRILLQTTLVSAILFALFALNYSYGWVTVAMLDFSAG